MSGIEFFLKVGLEVNAFLALSFVAFQAIRIGLEKGKFRLPAIVWLRTAQTTLTLGMILSVSFAILPSRQVPKMPLQIRQPLAEFSGKILKHSASLSQLVVPTSVPIVGRINSDAAFYSKWIKSVKAWPWKYAVVIFLGLGIVFCSCRFLLRYLDLRRLLSESTQLKSVRGVVVAVSDESTVPFSTRTWRRFWAVIPSSLVALPRDFQIAIQHELQHHRQGDTRWVLAIEFFEILFFLNPFIYRWRNTITELQELSCDDALIGRRGISSHEYGSCLLKVAEAALWDGRRHVGAACMSSPSHNTRHFKSFLRRRIEMLFQPKAVRPPWRWKVALGLLMGTVSFLLAYGAQEVMRQDDGQPNSGQIVVDETIEEIADNAVEAALDRYQADMVFAVVGDPRTGKILAVANRQRLNTKFSSPHWALSLRVEPASTMKALVAAAALSHGKTTPNEMFNCENGHYRIEGHDFGDWKPFDRLSTADTVIMSSNICGIKVAQKLGFEGLVQALSDFGIGPDGTTADFPESRAGTFLSTTTTSPDFFTATVGVGFGGIHMSPLEVVQAFGAIANGGKLMRPLSNDAPTSSIQIIRQVITPQAADEMKRILGQVTVRGTASSIKRSLYRLAGKTSTAYSPDFPDHDQNPGESQMAGFVGFAPLDNPRLVAYVGVMNPKDNKNHQAHGSSHAAPVFKEIAEKVLLYYNVPPDNG